MWKFLLLILTMGFIHFTPPIQQSLEYHNFADQRSWGTIPNFNDVMSNSLFIVFGLYDLWRSYRKYGQSRFPGKFYDDDTIIFRLYTRIAFALVTIWVGFGSAYYHFNPNNQTLIWDRLPMSIAFMLLLVWILLRARLIRVNEYLKVLVLLQCLGVGSVVIWALVDDLRLYGIVQFGSILCVFLLLLRGKIQIKTANAWASLVLYVAAKVCEHFDTIIYSVSGFNMSGHTLKHLLAAIATYYAGRVISK